ncbi:deoxyribodipyrimidine photolyase [Halorhodospira abdelmalekii]|uniref:cryptochrome/photolyase family protein n=1 Tax=Halorhodospira abdelmalekii TaxID=421629 RepID=UPI001905D97F|nr:deoxyribodipyrimidine photo-lyase [Halorhodospira abdelmalekii]MBK1735163.1 deoxyribodipyrimidine photolyase [Halorhodospira abdelmalekii]
MPRIAIVWLRRDLRLADQPALAAAAEQAERVLPLYVDDPHDPSLSSETAALAAAVGDAPLGPGTASQWWLHHSLVALQEALRRHGSELFIASGPSTATLLHWAQACGAERVFGTVIHEPWAQRCERETAHTLAEHGIELHLVNDALLTEPTAIRNRSGRPYRVFTPYWRQVRAQLAPPLPQPAPALPPPPTLPESCQALHPLHPEQLGLLPKVRWDLKLAEHWQPGCTAAAARFEALDGDFFAAYPQARDLPAQPGTSRLSPHLHFGEVSIRALWHRALSLSGSTADIESFLAELGWREFAYHLLAQCPDLDTQPVDRRFSRMPWRPDPDGALLAAWQGGRTGIPLVDAGMRQLWETGWLHNRLRMVVGSFLVKNLRLPWQHGEAFFRATLVDWDLAANSMGWQWVAGCGADAAPYFRIFNPVRQGERFDPRGDYIRRWVPELAALSDRNLQQPWTASSTARKTAGVTLGRTYPEPIVDLRSSREEALAAFQVCKEEPRD